MAIHIFLHDPVPYMDTYSINLVLVSTACLIGAAFCTLQVILIILHQGASQKLSRPPFLYVVLVPLSMLSSARFPHPSSRV